MLQLRVLPGVPLFHSRDLVHWRQIGNVLDRPGQLDLPADTPASVSIYAPTLRHHDGRFHLITTDVRGKGTFIVTADRPEGPWSDPVLVDVPGIDPDLAWDEEGNCWCAVAGVKVARIDPETGKVLEGPLPAWSGTGLQHPEAPHLYRIGDWWYLLLAEGGTAHGHSVSIARARSPRGPWEPAPANPVLTHRSTDLPVQSTGHADLVTAPDGTWWMVLLGTRPRGFFPGFHVLGRETFLTPVEWADGWPRVGPVREQHPAPAAWHPSNSPGTRRLRRPRPRLHLDLPAQPTGRHLVPDRTPRLADPRRRGPPRCSSAAANSTPTAARPPGSTPARRPRLPLRPHGRGPSLRHRDHRGVASVVARIGPVRQRLAEHPVAPGPVTLTVDITATGADTRGPDTLTFSVEGPEGAVELAELDGRYLSTQVAGGFTGRVIGMYAAEGAAAFDWFDYQPR